MRALVDGVLVLRAGVVVAASAGAAASIGRGDELPGAALRDLVHPDDPLPVPGAPTTVVRVLTPQAGHRWFEVTCVETDEGSGWRCTTSTPGWSGNASCSARATGCSTRST